jgi:HAE1 family hydrophobic/amphiphilic exporter-1
MAWPQVGAIVLIGVVVNNAIVLVDRINRLRNYGHKRFEAILEAGQNRFPRRFGSFLQTIHLCSDPKTLSRTGFPGG